VVHCRRHQIELRIVRQRRVDDLLPTPETHHDVQRHRIIAFEARGESRPAFDAENLFREQGTQFIRRTDRVRISPHEHAGMHHQEQVVRTGRRIGRERAGISEIDIIRRNSSFAGDPGFLVRAAQHVDMPRHVIHMPRVRAHGRERDRRSRRPFRLVRHFKDMDVQMHERRMRLDASLVSEIDRALANLERLDHV
jgi:hypothetical protein